MKIEKNKKLVVLILASGQGKRFSDKKPKQYYEINGIPILEITIKKFTNINFIHKIVTIINKNHRKYFNEIKSKFPNIDFINGGNNRQESSLIGLKYIKHLSSKYVLIHDAVRPYIDIKLLNRIYSSLIKYNAVIPVTKVKDSIKLVNKKKVLEDIKRKNLFFSQTPQGFKISELLIAYEKIGKNKLSQYTDDAQVYSEIGKKVCTVSGSEDNIKITTIEDFEFIKSLMEINSVIKIGQGIDVHKFKKGNKIKIFGKKIKFNKTLEGHSDADVGIHALIDAICGALNIGDIGKLFPNTSDKYKNIDSKILLKKVNGLIKENNAKLVHADNTIICERPKINKYSLDMRKIISKILGVKIDCISIKATTTEKLGFLGAEEGIAAMSIVTIRKLPE